MASSGKATPCLPSWRPCELCKPKELGKALPFFPWHRHDANLRRGGWGPQVFLSLQSVGSIPWGTTHTIVCSFFVLPTSSISQKHITQPLFLHGGEEGQMFKRLRLHICLCLCARLMVCKWPLVTTHHGLLSCTCT